MIAYDSKSNSEALLQVLKSLEHELDVQRQDIEKTCQIADQVGGLETVDVDELQAQVDKELLLHSAALTLLDTAQTRLENVMGMLRQFCRTEVVRTLELHKVCACEVEKWTKMADDAQIEQFELQEQSNKINKKLAEFIGKFETNMS